MLSGREYHQIGLRHFEEGEWNEAIQAYENAIKVNPKKARYWYYLGASFERANKLNKAIEALEKSIELEPDSELPHFILGMIYAKKFDFVKEIESHGKAIQINSDDEFWYELGEDCTRLTEKIQAYKNALTLNPNHVDATFQLGLIYYNQGKYDLAMEYLKKTIALQTNHHSAYTFIGNIAHKQENYEMAIAAYKQQTLIQPTNDFAWHNLGVMYKYHFIDFDEAIKACKMAVKINPKCYKHYYLLGSIYQEQENNKMTFIVYNQAISVHPQPKPQLTELLSVSLTSSDIMEIIKEITLLDAKEELPISHHKQIVESLKIHEENKSFFEIDKKILTNLENYLENLKNRASKHEDGAAKVYTANNTQTFHQVKRDQNVPNDNSEEDNEKSFLLTYKH